MHLSLLVLAVAYGAVAGLLVPRAAYRLAVEPGEPWRSDCPAGHPLAVAPVTARGWVGVARCAVCAPGWYGARSAGTALSGALVCGALAAAVGARPELGVWLLLVPFGMVLTLVDTAVHRLPDVLTLTLPGAAAALLGLAALLPGHAGSWTGALLGGLALGGVYALLFIIHPSGMGFGDVKLALTLGVALGWYGWQVLFAGAFAGFLLGSFYGIGLLVARRAGRKTALPFGPFMLCGTLLGLLLGGFTGS